jgi:phosphorylcholine metabolism protein LicD
MSPFMLKRTIRDFLYRIGLYASIKKILLLYKKPSNRIKASKMAPEIICRVGRACRKEADAYWLDYGTLLGYRRHGTLLPGDDDLDFGVMVSDGTSLQKTMEAEGMVLVKQVRVEGAISLEQYRYRGLRFDLFYYRQVGEKIVTHLWLPNHYMMPQPHAYKTGQASLSETTFESFETKEIEFYGCLFCIPEDTDAYLQQHYGEDFMVPDPTFTYADECNSIKVEKEHTVLFMLEDDEKRIH